MGQRDALGRNQLASGVAHRIRTAREVAAGATEEAMEAGTATTTEEVAITTTEEVVVAIAVPTLFSLYFI